MTLEVFGQVAASTDQGEDALDDPALGENDEAMQFIAFDDLIRHVPAFAAALA